MTRPCPEPERLYLDLRPLRLARRRVDVTQRELAHACKVYAKAPLYWERNERMPSAEALIRAARFLGVPWFQLVDVIEGDNPAKVPRGGPQGG